MKYIYIIIDRYGRPTKIGFESRRKAYRIADLRKGHNALRIELIEKKFDRADFVKIVPKKKTAKRKKQKRK